jgi:uncharacterized protein YlxW (UPF0749 family)
VIKTKIGTILALGLVGVLVNYAGAFASQAYAAGGLMGLVAHGAQDVYLTNQVNKLQSEENKTQSQVNKLQSEENKLQSEINKLQSDCKTH